MAFTYQDFHRNFMQIKEKSPNYRLGQHFCNLFLKDPESHEVSRGLDSKTGDEAAMQIYEVIKEYCWSLDDLPLRNFEEERRKRMRESINQRREKNPEQFLITRNKRYKTEPRGNYV